MNKTPKGSTLDVFQKTFFPKFELLNSGCGLSAGVYSTQLPSTPRQPSTTQLPSTLTQPSTTQQLTTPWQPSTTRLHVMSTPRWWLSVESPQLASILSPIGYTVPRSLFGSLSDSQPEVIGLLNQISEQQKESIHCHKLTLQCIDALIAILGSPTEPAPASFTH